MFLSAKTAAVFFVLLNLIFVNPGSLIAQVEPDNSLSHYVLKKGARIRVRMDNEINSKSSSADDTFTAVVSRPVIVGETVVLPSGPIVHGRVTRSKAASGSGKNGLLEVAFERITFKDGGERKLNAKLVDQLTEKSSRSGNVLTVIAGAAFGAVIGALTKVKNGTLIGAGIGTGGGTATVLVRKGMNVRIKADEEFEIELTNSLQVPAEGF